MLHEVWSSDVSIGREFWSTVLSIIRDVVVGVTLGYLAVHLDRLKRQQREHERHCNDQKSLSRHSKGAAAGGDHDLDREHADDAGDRAGAGVRHPRS